MKKKAANPSADGRLLLLISIVVLAAVVVSVIRSWVDPSSGNEPPAKSSRVYVAKRPALGYPTTRTFPLRIEPTGELASLVADRDVRIALQATLPYWDPPGVATMLHALRLWGREAKFPPDINGNEVLSGGGMVETLLDNDLCIQRNRNWFDEYLVQTPHGIRIATSHQALSGELLGVTHVDQLLQVLGEAGVPRDTPVRASSGETGDVGDLLDDSLMRFTLQQELEFSACAFARWLPPRRSWTNRFGREYAFDDIAAELSSRSFGTGACNGCHVVFALVNLFRADEQMPILSQRIRRGVESRLRECTLLLEENELADGGWNHRWSAADRADAEPKNVYGGRFDRIAVTGHHLEWIALAPAEVRPSIPVLRRAVHALVADIHGCSEPERANFKNFWPLSHAARALTLLKDAAPTEFLQIRAAQSQSAGRTASEE